jgi:hypothetical protein
MRQLNARDRYCCVLDRLKPSIMATRCFMLRWSCSIRLFRNFDERTFVSRGQQAIGFKFAHRTVRGRVAVQRNPLRGAALALDRLAEERLGSPNITMRA